MLFLFHQTAGGLDETFFKTIDDLIRHYKRKNQGLAMHLRHSVKRKTALLIQPQRELQAQPSKSPEQRPRRTEREPWRQPDSVPEEEHDYESTPYIFSVCSFLSYFCLAASCLVCLTFALFIQMLLSLSTSKSFLINVGHQTPNETFGGNRWQEAHRLDLIQDDDMWTYTHCTYIHHRHRHVCYEGIKTFTAAELFKMLLDQDLNKSSLSAPIRMNCSNSIVLFPPLTSSGHELTAILPQTWDKQLF